MRRVHVVVASFVGIGCGALAEDPRALELRRGQEIASLLRERACASVVAAYRNGARPTAVEVQVPGPQLSDPPSRLLLVGPHVPTAEGCLGLPEILVTPAPLAPAAPAPAPATATSARRSPLDTRF
jgi:hypothetical protein